MTSPIGLPSRICKLKECAKSFQPVTSWQEYHSAQCRNRDNWLLRKQGMQLVRERQVKA